jgi:hypothetical protein
MTEVKVRANYFGDSFDTITPADCINRIQKNTPTYEVITEDIPVKLYFDFDCVVPKEDYSEGAANQIEKILTTNIEKNIKALYPEITPNMAIMTCHTENYETEKSKYSIRYFISNFKAIQSTQYQLANCLNQLIFDQTDITDYIEIDKKKKDVFDLSVYTKNRKMRCQNTSKPDENRPFIIKQGTLENTIIQAFFDDICEEIILEAPIKNGSSCAVAEMTADEEKMSDIEYLLMVCIQDNMCKENQHADWIKIGQALKNELGDDATEPFINWTYKYGSENKKKEAVQHITKYIKKTPAKDKDRLTIKTVYYYAKIHNEPKYKARFYKKVEYTINDEIEKVMLEATEYSIAEYFKKYYGSNFNCVDIKNKIIYEFTKNKLWEQFEAGTNIRELLSNEVKHDFDKYRDSMDTFHKSLQKDTEEASMMRKKVKVLGELTIKLGRTNDKNNIVREILDKIVNPKFEATLNKQKYILPIKDGKVLDMKTLETHDRTIEHSFSYECNATYVELTAEQDADIKQYFMSLFCQKENTMNCVLDILKSILSGDTLRYIYFFTGDGSNGKSLLFTILQAIFKKAMDTIDTRVILESKSSSNLTTEFEKLDKCRIGYITELKETDKLNEPVIKKISGSDPIDYRGLYKGNQTILPTCNLCVLTNQLPTFKVEKAILNRIIVVPFNNVFEVDKSFETKMLEKADLVFSFIMKHGTIRDKFDLTEEMLVAKQNYKDDNTTVDYLHDFINKYYDIVSDKVEVQKYDKNGKLTKKTITPKIERDTFRDCYNTYLKTKGQPIDKSTHQKFSRLIKNYNIDTKESNSKTYYTNLVRKEQLDEESDDEE